MWDLPGPGPEPVSPALAGGLPTTVPPGKPLSVVLSQRVCGTLHSDLKKLMQAAVTAGKQVEETMACLLRLLMQTKSAM